MINEEHENCIKIINFHYNIPEDWDIHKIKHLLETPVTDGPHETPEFIENGIPFLSVDSIKDGRLVFENCRFISEKDHIKFKNKCNPQKNDVFVGKAASIGKIAIVNVDFEFSIWSPLALLRPNLNKILPKFLEYSLKSDYAQDQIDLYATSNTQKNISMDDIPRIQLITPPINQQTLIINHLNKKTSEIDLTIEKDTRLIELLKEKRTALINHVVTKGLDPTVKMKDSGVEWIGEIPEDWSMIKVKHLAGNCSNPVQTGPFGAQLHAEDYMETGIPLILIRNVNNDRINIKNIPFVSEEDAIRLSMYRLNMGDVVFSRVGSLGRAALVTKNEEGWLISGQMLRLRLPDKRINTHYLVYVFQSDLSTEYVSLESVGSTRESLNTEILSNLPFPLPSKEKQESIVEYLDNETSKIDKSILKIQENIELLGEYKKSLIHHVVTGKVDVRAVAV